MEQTLNTHKMSDMGNPLDTKASRRTFSGAFKAQVVLEALENKRRLDDIAREYNLHPNQIKNWKCLLRKRIDLVFEDRRRSCTPGM